MTTVYPIMVPHGSASEQLLTVKAPYDGAEIAQVEKTNAQGIEQALVNAFYQYQSHGAWLSVPERIEILEQTASLIQQNAEWLASEAAKEGGKPLIDSQVEVSRAIDGLKICVEVLRSDSGQVIPMGYSAASLNRLAFTQKEPIGVVVAVSAFNHPLNLIVHQVAPAIATGCPVIVKPSSDTPISCIHFVNLLREAGLPEEMCQVVIPENNDLSTQLVTDNRVAFFSFIGSAKTGWMLRSKLAPGTRCALEHGGVAPVIVEKDANLETTIPLITKGGFYHAGQVCVSVQRVFVHQDIVETFTEQLVSQAKALKIGDPTSPETEVGPIIRHAETQRIHDWVTEAVSLGGQLLCGGNKLSDSTYECTVLLNPPYDAQISQAEIFGPVICVYTYVNIDDAIEHANSLKVAFQAAVFTQCIDTALYAYKNINASAVMVNDHTAFRVDGMPFAGLKESGLGVGGIPHTMHDMQVEKMMVIKSKSL